MQLQILIDLIGLDVKDLLWYQMFIRAIIVFVSAILFIRIAGMRSFGTRSAFDVVLSITIGAVLSRCISGHYPFFESLGTAMLLAFLHRSVAWLSCRSKTINKLVQGDRIPLFKDGKIIGANVARHSISEQDLFQALHENNIDDFKTVSTIWFEPDGKISVVEKSN